MQLRIESVPSLFSEGCETDAAGADNDNYAGIIAAQQAQRNARREMLLQESFGERATRFAQAVVRALNPKCLNAIGPTFDLLWRERAIRTLGLPDPAHALATPDGLVGLAEDLSPGVLASAYGRGLHARCLMGPVTYWAPAMRLAQHPAQLRLDQKLRSLIHKGEYDVAFDRDFDLLLMASAAPSAHQPRLHPRLLRAYTGLFDAGMAHCFEVRDQRGRLAGGGFGAAVGRNFIIERLLSPQPQAARLGLAVLAQHLNAWGYRMIDASFVGAFVEGMNFEALSRADYNRKLDVHASGGRPGLWRVEEQLYAARRPSTAVRSLFDMPARRRPADVSPALALQAELMRTLATDQALRDSPAMKNPSVAVVSGLSRTP